MQAVPVRISFYKQCCSRAYLLKCLSVVAKNNSFIVIRVLEYWIKSWLKYLALWIMGFQVLKLLIHIAILIAGISETLMHSQTLCPRVDGDLNVILCNSCTNRFLSLRQEEWELKRAVPVLWCVSLRATSSRWVKVGIKVGRDGCIDSIYNSVHFHSFSYILDAEYVLFTSVLYVRCSWLLKLVWNGMLPLVMAIQSYSTPKFHACPQTESPHRKNW